MSRKKGQDKGAQRKWKMPDLSKAADSLQSLRSRLKDGHPIQAARSRRRIRGKKVTAAERQAVVLKQRIVIGVILLIFLMWFIRGLHYCRHFQKNTYVNGVNVSSMTLKQAKAKLKEEIPKDYSITVVGPNGTEEVIGGSDLEIEIVSADHARKALRKQAAFSWLTQNGKEKHYEIDLEVSYNEDNLHNAISALQMMQEDQMIQPEDSKIIENENGRYQIVPEVVGTKLDTVKTRAMIAEAVSFGCDVVDVREAQELPEILSDNENLVKRESEWNRFFDAVGLTYHVCETDVVFDGPKIASLLTDDGETVILDKDKITDLVMEWCYSYNTYDSQFEFKTYYGTTVTIDPYGNYGYEINDEALPNEIYQKINTGDHGTYEVSYYNKPLYNYNNGLGGNYVEINVEKQRLWVWKDGEVVVDTSVVTGLPVFGRTTYYGCYAINLMQEHAVLGDVNVEGYESKVNYWVRFNSGEGIHDASWRSSFGGKIWLYDGSHGCVNVPVDEMPDIYANVFVGEAVVVYGMEYDSSVWESSTKTVNVDYYEIYYENKEKEAQ